MAANGSLNVPIWFLRPLKLMPVLPPTDASTAASRVVGILIQRMPRLKVAAANPPISQTMPPPRFISRSLRVASRSDSRCHISVSAPRFLLLSPASIHIISAVDALLELLVSRGNTSLPVLLSTTIITRGLPACATRPSVISPTRLLKISFCFIVFEQCGQNKCAVVHRIYLDIGSCRK